MQNDLKRTAIRHLFENKVQFWIVDSLFYEYLKLVLLKLFIIFLFDLLQIFNILKIITPINFRIKNSQGRSFTIGRAARYNQEKKP